MVNGSQATTNGHILASHNGPLLIVAFKQRVAMPGPQLVGYFMRLALKANERIFRGWRQPTLGLLDGSGGKCTSWQRSLIQELHQERVCHLFLWPGHGWCASPGFPSRLYSHAKMANCGIECSYTLAAAFHPPAARDLLTRVENDTRKIL